VRLKRPINYELLISAVSYLNTWPLVWGFLHGPQKGLFDFRFDLPAVCAQVVAEGKADIGLVPSAELDRLKLSFLTDVGIACEGAVRSILLVSRRPLADIRTVAVDWSSRTSVALTRIILAQRYGCRPVMTAQAPRLEDMLAESDAALIIGDPALDLDPDALPYHTLDLGAEWVAWTGLPMVFAVWAGHEERLTERARTAFLESYEWGLGHIDEMVAQAAEERGFEPALAREYLTRHIVYRLSAKHLEGLRLFRRLAAELPVAQVA
jgi:predicted solute-binding protein